MLVGKNVKELNRMHQSVIRPRIRVLTSERLSFIITRLYAIKSEISPARETDTHKASLKGPPEAI